MSTNGVHTDHEIEPGAILDPILENCFTISLHVHWPKLTGQIRQGVVKVATASGEVALDDDKRKPPQWDLMPKEWHKKFSGLESKGRAVLQSNSYPATVRGCVFVPLAKLATVCNELREIKSDFMEAAEEFILIYPQLVENLKYELGQELFLTAQRVLPPKDRLRGRFRMIWPLVALPPTKLNAAQLVGLEEFLDEARTYARTVARETVIAMIQKPREQLCESAEVLLRAIEEGRQIRAGTLDNVRRALNELQSFEFLTSEEMKNRIIQAQTMLAGVTPHDVNSGLVSDVLSRAVSSVAELARDSADLITTAKSFRGLRFSEIPDINELEDT